MQVEGVYYVNSQLESLMLDELKNSAAPGQSGGFLPGVKQIANVASLPGVVGRSIGLPDAHSGYGFAIGNVAAFDVEDPMVSSNMPVQSFIENCQMLSKNFFILKILIMFGFTQNLHLDCIEQIDIRHCHCKAGKARGDFELL